MTVRLALALATSLAAAAPAAAARYHITYDGFVGSGYDGAGIFGEGANGLSLNGQLFTVVFTLTSPRAGALAAATGNSSAIFGGYGFDDGTSRSPMSAVITINGVRYAFDAGYFSQAYQYLDTYNGQRGSVYHHVAELRETPWGPMYSEIYTTVSSRSTDFVQSTNYTDPLDYTVADTGSGFGDSSYGQLNIARGFGITSASLVNQRVRIALAPAGAVPEPSAWALLILGFGATGAAMRGARRKRTAVSYG